MRLIQNCVGKTKTCWISKIGNKYKCSITLKDPKVSLKSKIAWLRDVEAQSQSRNLLHSFQNCKKGPVVLVQDVLKKNFSNPAISSMSFVGGWVMHYITDQRLEPVPSCARTGADTGIQQHPLVLYDMKKTWEIIGRDWCHHASLDNTLIWGSWYAWTSKILKTEEKIQKMKRVRRNGKAACKEHFRSIQYLTATQIRNMDIRVLLKASKLNWWTRNKNEKDKSYR